MEITLRRAAAIQDLIRETRASISISAVATVSVFSDVGAQVMDERAEMRHRMARRDALEHALQDIRKAVGRANAEAGVSDLLAEQARIGRLIEDLTPLAEAAPYEGTAIASKRAARAATTDTVPASPYGRNQGAGETIQVNLFCQDHIEEARVRLLDARKAKSRIKDRLAEINAMTRIELSAETEDTLTQEHLI